MSRLKICLIIFSMFFSPALFAFEEKSTIPVRNLVVRQQRQKAGAICISGPVALDERIVDTLVINSINSLEDYLRWLKANIKYEKDASGDCWAHPEDTLSKKSADCEDFAFLNEAVLRVMGYQPQVLAMGGFGRQHAFCVFQEDDNYFWIDNFRLKKTQARTLEDFARHIFNEYGSCYLLSIDFQSRDWDILFKRSALLGKD